MTSKTDETLEADLEALRFARDIILTHNARVAETAAMRASHPQCANCGNPAACLGSYESNDAWAYACSDCCAHGNEDGCCFPLAEVPARYQALLLREEALADAAAGRCVPAVCTTRERIECAAALLGLTDPEQLAAALSDCRLAIVDAPAAPAAPEPEPPPRP